MLNLYEFSQGNNNEMGILIQRGEDSQLYKDAYEEAQRIIRISEEVRITLERVSHEPEASAAETVKGADSEPVGDKLASSKIAAKLGMKTAQFMDRAAEQGFLTVDGEKHLLTAKGERQAWSLWPSPGSGLASSGRRTFTRSERTPSAFDS